MSFSVLIPARLASSRLPRKPLADIAGLPMIVRVARQAQLSLAKQVVVDADDTEIVQACTTHGVVAMLTRFDHATGSDLGTSHARHVVVFFVPIYNFHHARNLNNPS